MQGMRRAEVNITGQYSILLEKNDKLGPRFELTCRINFNKSS